MRASFINNFSFEISSTLSDSANELAVASSITEEIADALKGHDWGEEYRSFMPLTLTDGEAKEIIYVTEASSSGLLTIQRGKEGTSASEWPIGTRVENRVTAAAANCLWHVNEDSNCAFGIEAKADGWGSVALSWNAYAKGSQSVAIGSEAFAGISGSVALGEAARVAEEGFSAGVSVGQQARCNSGSVSVGQYSKAQSENSVSVGGYAETSEDFSVSIGAHAQTSASSSVALGAFADASGEHSVALGRGATATIDGGFRVGVMPYLAKSVINGAASHRKNTGTAAVFALDEISLSSGSDFADLDLPENTILLIDSLDWITTVSDAPGGAPEIQVGTDATDNDTLLPATALIATGLHERQTFTPTHSNGVTSVHVSVAVAATGTAQAGKLVVRGYVMEV